MFPNRREDNRVKAFNIIKENKESPTNRVHLKIDPSGVAIIWAQNTPDRHAKVSWVNLRQRALNKKVKEYVGVYGECFGKIYCLVIKK